MQEDIQGILLMHLYYKLDENKNVIPSSLEEWSTFIGDLFPANYRRVGYDTVNGKRISTVFMGLCHNYTSNSNIPLVFETMIFDENKQVIYQERYPTCNEAEEGHKEAVQWVLDGCKDENI